MNKCKYVEHYKISRFSCYLNKKIDNKCVKKFMYQKVSTILSQLIECQSM